MCTKKVMDHFMNPLNMRERYCSEPSGKRGWKKLREMDARSA
jgi:hypothetical protein